MPPEERSTSSRAIEAGTYLATHMHEAPVIAVFCYNPDMMTITDKEQPRPSVVGGGSVYPAVQNLLLACRNEGLGCVLTTLFCLEEPKVRELLRAAGGLVHVRTCADRLCGRRRPWSDQPQVDREDGVHRQVRQRLISALFNAKQSRSAQRP